MVGRLGRGITIKVGLSRISVALHEGDRILRMRTWKTPPPGEAESLRPFFSALWPDISSKDIPSALVCVVPDLAEPVALLWEARSGQRPDPFFLSHAPFSVDYRPPESLGADRGAAVWGALVCFGEILDPAFMVADFGTHTVTTVCFEGRLLGGAILPGLSLMEKSLGAGRVNLSGKGRLLDRERLSRCRALGRSTGDGVFSGVVLGSVLAVEALGRRAEEELGVPLRIVLTGGMAPVVAPLFKSEVLVSRQVVHYGAWSFLSGNRDFFPET